MTTETNYRDFPRLTMNGDLLLVAHNAANSKADTDGDRPVLSAYHLPSLRQGSDDPPNWQYYSSDLNDAPRVFLVSHRGNTSGLSFVTDIRGDVTLRVAAFVPASEPHLAPAPIFASHDLGSAAPWPGPFMVFRSNTLHMAGQVQVAARVANQQPPRLSIRALRIPFATASPTTIMIDHGAVNDLIFGKNAPTDAAGDLVTYEVSGTAVNKHGDAIYVFGRTGIVTAQPLFPEVRYSVWAHSESKPRRSALLRAGDYQPQWFYDPPDPTSGPRPPPRRRRHPSRTRTSRSTTRRRSSIRSTTRPSGSSTNTQTTTTSHTTIGTGPRSWGTSARRCRDQCRPASWSSKRASSATLRRRQRARRID